jgi:hypothetical protein
MEGARGGLIQNAYGGRREGESESPSAVAEALSTAFMVLGRQEIADLCRDWPAVEAWLHPSS